MQPKALMNFLIFVYTKVRMYLYFTKILIGHVYFTYEQHSFLHAKEEDTAIPILGTPQI